MTPSLSLSKTAKAALSSDSVSRVLDFRAIIDRNSVSSSYNLGRLARGTGLGVEREDGRKVELVHETLPGKSIAPSASVSPSLTMSWSSASLGFCPRDRITAPNSLDVMFPGGKKLLARPRHF